MLVRAALSAAVLLAVPPAGATHAAPVSSHAMVHSCCTPFEMKRVQAMTGRQRLRQARALLAELQRPLARSQRSLRRARALVARYRRELGWQRAVLADYRGRAAFHAAAAAELRLRLAGP